MDISRLSGEKIFNEYQFSETAVQELKDCFSYVAGMLEKARSSVENQDKSKAQEVLGEKDKLRKMERKFNKNHVKRVKKNCCKPEVTGIFSGVLQNLDRIGISCINIAEEVLEEE